MFAPSRFKLDRRMIKKLIFFNIESGRGRHRHGGEGRKRFSNCAQGLSTLFFLFSWAFFAFCAAKVEQKGEVISSTYQYLTSYMRTIPWFSSGSFMENDI
jgi:hypothetical protein